MQQIYELPELSKLKEILKDPKNIAWIKRVKWEGSKEQKDYVKRKIKELNALLEIEENNYSGSRL